MAYAGKNFGGVQGRGSGLVGGPGGLTLPRTPENFRKFAKKFPKKIAKMLYFRLFCKKISKPCVTFSRVWTKNTIVWGNFEKILKIFDGNSIEKLNFYLFLGKLLLKIETSEITSFFYSNFFRLGGGANPPPAYATDQDILEIKSEKEGMSSILRICVRGREQQMYGHYEQCSQRNE